MIYRQNFISLWAKNSPSIPGLVVRRAQAVFVTWSSPTAKQIPGSGLCEGQTGAGGDRCMQEEGMAQMPHLVTCKEAGYVPAHLLTAGKDLPSSTSKGK